MPLLPNGTLFRTFSDPKVYLIEEGKKRWVDSEATFRVQGFQDPSIVYVADDRLGLYPDGEPVTDVSRIIMPGEVAVLPDLAPFGAGNLRLAKVGGRSVLRFSTSFWNTGKGPFELFTLPVAGKPADNTYHTAYQHLVGVDGSVRNKIVGSLLFHLSHGHYHHADFADYKLELVRPADGSPATAAAVTQKTTFCMRDDLLISKLPGSPPRPVYAGCGRLKQGVSVGWTDVYPYTLPDQLFDVQDLPAGVYKLTIAVDPRGRFVESNVDNNVSASLIELDVKKGIMKPLSDGSPFPNRWTHYEEGMLLQTEGYNRVYVIHNNTKRQLRTEEVFNSYGYATSSIYVLPKGLLEAIPDTDFVARAGTDIVYSISAKRLIGKLADLAGLGGDPTTVHFINETDFNAYAF